MNLDYTVVVIIFTDRLKMQLAVNIQKLGLGENITTF